MSGPRSTQRWKRVRAQVLKGATVCELPGCQGPPLDFEARRTSRWAPSVDHIDPVSLAGDPFAVENLRPVHYGCNSARGNGTRPSASAVERPPAPRATWW